MKTIAPRKSAAWFSITEAAASAGANFLAMGAGVFARGALFQLQLTQDAAKAGQAQLEALSAMTEPDWYLRRVVPALEQARTELAFMAGGPGEDVPFQE